MPTILGLAITLGFPAAAWAASQSALPRKLVHVGWDNTVIVSAAEERLQAQLLAANSNHWVLYYPPSEFKGNLSRMQATPLEGITVLIHDPDPDTMALPFWETGRKHVSHRIFSRRRYRYEELTFAVEQLSLLRHTHLTDNFLSIVTGLLQGDDRDTFSWFDDTRWDTILNNFRVYARIAREADMKLMIDPEGYEADRGIMFSVFGSTYQRDKSQHTVAEYKAQARLRGGQVLRAIQEGAPAMELLFYMAHSVLIAYSSWAPVNVDLLPAFLDGMLEENARSVTPSIIIDGYEPAYWLEKASDFTAARGIFRDKVIQKNWTAVPTLYRQYMRLSFGIWADLYDPAYSTPKAFEDTLVNALNESDRYVWIYSERINTFFPNSPTNPPSITPAFTQAVVNAKARHLAAYPAYPGFNAWAAARGLPAGSGSADADGDGTSNLDEYLAGTDPKDPQSRFSIGIVPGTAAVELSFPALRAQGAGYTNLNRTYSILRHDLTTNGTRTIVPESSAIPGDGAIHRCLIRTTNAPGGFYSGRVELSSQ